MEASEQSSDQSTSQPLLNETQRVLNQQVNIVQNQQAQATRIIRVSLTIAGLLLTLSSIAVTVVVNAGTDNLLVKNVKLTYGSAATALLLFYLVFIMLGAFAVIFISAFLVLNPQSSVIRTFTIRPAFQSELLRNTLKIYDRVIPFISISFTDSDFNDIENERSYSLRAGVDSDAVDEISGSDDRVADILDYNSGCIQGNEQLIENNRRLLSNIYTTATLVTVTMFLLFLLGALYVLPLPG